MHYLASSHDTAANFWFLGETRHCRSCNIPDSEANLSKIYGHVLRVIAYQFSAAGGTIRCNPWCWKIESKVPLLAATRLLVTVKSIHAWPTKQHSMGMLFISCQTYCVLTAYRQNSGFWDLNCSLMLGLWGSLISQKECLLLLQHAPLRNSYLLTIYLLSVCSTPHEQNA